MTKIKICGLSRPEDIEAVNEYLPDYIGLVFAKSRRQISDSTAIELKRRLDPRIAAVGVFVNEKQDRILHLCETGVIDLIQLHGEETEEYIKELKKRVPNQIIKAVRVQRKEEVERAQGSCSDHLLFDTFMYGQYGGAGQAFDWSLLLPAKRPFFLAGGLHSENVLQAIHQVKPYAIDVSSGVERDGRKDTGKIKELITRIRSEI